VSTSIEGEFDTSLIGVDSDPVSFDVEREGVLAYAAATNDEIAQHADATYAPPVFAVVVAFETLAPTTVKVVPPQHLMRVVHGEQDFRFHRRIEPGDRLTTTARVIGITPKSSGVVIETACPEDPSRLRRLAVRFSRPCLPGQQITTRIWEHGDGIYVYETTSDAGDVVIKDGFAEVASA
jgi:acyl dehydratase